MSCDDSFNDSDEIFNLYSSKNITETFRTQLKKIVESNKHLTDVNTSQKNNEETIKKTNSNEEILVVSKKQEVTSTQEASKEIITGASLNASTGDGQQYSLDDSGGGASLNRSTGDGEQYSLDDSVEVIDEFMPKPARQSERLRRKRKENGKQDSSGISSDVTIIKQVTGRRKQRSRRGRHKKGEPIAEVTLDDSAEPTETEDELNPEVSVKVIWKSVNVKKFMIRKFQKLSHLYELLAKEENIAKDNIILTFNNVRVNQNDTPDSLNFQVYHFLDGGVINETTSLCSMSSSNPSDCNDESVKLKFQDINKKIITLNLNKNEKLKVGMIMCSEQLEVPLDKIRFFFDGELIQPSETPESLGLEGGEVIDIKITDK